MNATILLTIMGGLLIGAMILAVIVTKILKKCNSIELVQGKLENSDSAIADAIPYLKITNEWSK